jgi:serine protease Do
MAKLRIFIFSLALTLATINPGLALGTPQVPFNNSEWTFPADDETLPDLPSNYEVWERVAPATVSILSITEVTGHDFLRRPYTIEVEGTGSGIIIDSCGYIATNYHMVKDAQKITVTLNDGRSFTATKVGEDPWTDLAVIRIEADDLPCASFLRDSLDKLKIGDEVIAIGNALSLVEGPTVTKGIVSYLGRSIPMDEGLTLYDLIQTDAAINPGNSGGALVNMAGQVVGINNVVIAGEAIQNIGFAISTDLIIPVVESLIQKGYVLHPWLGISMYDLTPDIAKKNNLPVDKGVVLGDVAKGGPADEAGLKKGDIIVRWGGESIEKGSQVLERVRKSDIGKTAEITILREEKEMNKLVTFSHRPLPEELSPPS